MGGCERVRVGGGGCTQRRGWTEDRGAVQVSRVVPLVSRLLLLLLMLSPSPDHPPPFFPYLGQLDDRLELGRALFLGPGLAAFIVAAGAALLGASCAGWRRGRRDAGEPGKAGARAERGGGAKHRGGSRRSNRSFVSSGRGGRWRRGGLLFLCWVLFCFVSCVSIEKKNEKRCPASSPCRADFGIGPCRCGDGLIWACDRVAHLVRHVRSGLRGRGRYLEKRERETEAIVSKRA